MPPKKIEFVNCNCRETTREGGTDGSTGGAELERWRGRGAELVLLLLKFAPKEERRSNDEGAPLRAWSKPVLFWQRPRDPREICPFALFIPFYFHITRIAARDMNDTAGAGAEVRSAAREPDRRRTRTDARRTAFFPRRSAARQRRRIIDYVEGRTEEKRRLLPLSLFPLSLSSVG